VPGVSSDAQQGLGTASLELRIEQRRSRRRRRRWVATAILSVAHSNQTEDIDCESTIGQYAFVMDVMAGNYYDTSGNHSPRTCGSL
jgi:hypothetical protein